MAVAEDQFGALALDDERVERRQDRGQARRQGAIGRDLKKVRNVKPLWSKYGLVASLMGRKVFDRPTRA